GGALLREPVGLGRDICSYTSHTHHLWNDGSNESTKTNCLPQCQNGGMCLRPQLCVCKPGSKGKACEQNTMPTSSYPAQPGNGHTNGHSNGHTKGHNVVPQRPIPQQGYIPGPVPVSNMAQMTLTVKQSPHLHPGSQQFVRKPKYYHTQTTHTQTHVQHQPDRPIPLTVGHNPIHVGNHTGRIKVVFTPTICKVTCTGGRCQNNCELGNTTTIVSENGHAADTLTAPNFRVVVCHLPCMNGGKCSARDKCQCPPTFTGKFCQMPVQNGNGQQRQNGQHIVNIHVKHPPEASVQIHQVSQLDSSQKIQQQGHNIIYPNLQSYVPQYQPVSNSQLGRCFQETTGTQCGKALPGLSKQEECCQSIGTSWGFHKCQKCPKPCKQAMDCPQGYKRINNSHCQDLNECQLQGVCPNGDCLNTMGSYRCSCKAGFIPDPTLSTCIPDTPAVHEEKGACFRLVSSGKQCLHPVPAQLSKQLCCCSVGKAWGPRCDKCPLPGTAKFKEICPGGMGYTVTGSYKPKLPNQLPKLPSQPETINKPKITHQEPVAPPLPFPTPEKPVEALSVTERQLPSIPEVVEKTSPPAPALILPSNAGQDIAPTQSAEVDECQVNPHICGQGICYNTVEGYTCICREGYQMDETHTTCVDVDECLESASLCSNGRCRNTPGSFLCVCQPGFMTDEEGTSCIDLNECLNSHACPEDGFCVNNVGSYICRHCDSGFRMSPTGQCEDIDECLDMGVCPSGMCVNLLGSYECDSCPEGFQGQGGQCVDVDECLHQSTCANGKCSNFEGYFVCSCNDGFTLSLDGQSCEDVDECQDEQVCTRGHCQNTVGSYLCNCGPGFRASPAGDQCDDVDECQELTMPCDRVGQCVNNMGSYHCSCPQGYQQINGTSCLDVDECLDDPELCSPHGECLNAEGSFYCVCERGFAAGQDTHTCEDIDECNVNATVCGNHGFCENTVGSFRCLCDRGYQESQEGLGCADVNECELLSGVCGEALCENVEGSFLCMCPDEDQEYNQMTAKCSPAPTASSVERKECYYNLNDENLCENVLTSSVTMEECCCTLGAGWGDNCEVHPCPVQGTDQFSQMCPAGRGNVPTETRVVLSLPDADECALFGQEICKDGFCLNSPGSYECYCKTGLYYDEVKLQCRDIDECQDESSCVGGECLNTQGSYMCFCTRPMVLDSDNKRCVIAPEVAEQHSVQTDYQGICWQTITGTRKTCTKPLANRKTTFTECCCLHGEAWGMDCALCPLKNTEDYASMCNVPMREGQGRPYGRDALVAEPVQEYEVNLDYEPRPDQPGALPLYEDEEIAYDAFEGLRAEECGILNGCENGRCVRVQEGYTCDCFDGYTLDMSRMACVDVNECSELNNRMSLCKNAKCINTEGSYKCVCLPGYTPSEQPNYCVAREQEAAAAARTERE
uniref:Latent-transforming growth factor beta-binding protein 1 n=1 Tax=Oncorhynchus tshawytscha TaxID=74940 RepID=A0A8C8F3D2_ONCTS